MKYCFCCLVVYLYCFQPAAAQDLQPPVTQKKGKTFAEHGHQRQDDYFWLNDKRDSNVINHLKAENAYTEAYLKPTEGLQKKLYNEIVSRIQQQDQSLPVKEAGYWYYSRFEEGKQYPDYYRRKGTMTAPEETVLNVNTLAKGHQIYLLRGWKMSRDNNILAYAIDTSGDRRSTLYFKNVKSGTLLPETVANTSGDIAWANDGKTVCYILNDPTVRSYKVMRHTLGSATSNDETIYTEQDSTYSVDFSVPRNNRYIFLVSHSTNTTEARYLDANKSNAAPVLIQARTPGLEYRPFYFEGALFHIQNNKDAKNYKLSATPISKPGMENWKDVIAHNPDALLEEVLLLKNFLVAQTKEKGLTQIRITNRKTGKQQAIDFGNSAYVSFFSPATDAYDLDSIRYAFMSITTPNSQYSYNLATQQKTLLKQQKAGTYNPDAYETIRIWAKATDGTAVPISLAYKKDKLKKDGSNPLYLYAYGSYGINSDPYFNNSIISLLDRGFLFAIAHIRGGQELGRTWYESGRVLKKKNTFTDFIDAAQFLISEKYTAADRLFANGGSAGGMLMGAITNMRPDLFRGVIAEVPWMDVITDMYDTSLPLTTLEYEEWGDPNNEEMYNYMLSWSPLDNVKRQKYPAILATGGLNDTQVPYFSPAKWVAKVRENNEGQNPVLFKVNMGAGHGGESGRFERQKLQALKYAFVLHLLGWNEESGTYKDIAF